MARFLARGPRSAADAVTPVRLTSEEKPGAARRGGRARRAAVAAAPAARRAHRAGLSPGGRSTGGRLQRARADRRQRAAQRAPLRAPAANREPPLDAVGPKRAPPADRRSFWFSAGRGRNLHRPPCALADLGVGQPGGVRAPTYHLQNAWKPAATGQREFRGLVGWCPGVARRPSRRCCLRRRRDGHRRARCMPIPCCPAIRRWEPGGLADATPPRARPRERPRSPRTVSKRTRETSCAVVFAHGRVRGTSTRARHLRNAGASARSR